MRIRPGVWLAAYAAFFAVVTLTFLSSYPLPEIHSKLVAAGSAVFLFSSFFCMGQLAMSLPGPLRLRPFGLTPFLEIFVSFGLGFGILGLFVLAVGVMGLSLRIGLTILSFLLAAALLFRIVNHRRIFPRVPLYQKITLIHGVLLSLAGCGALLTLITCFSPITYYDSLVYHLALPSIYNRWDAIRGVPFNLYSTFPAIGEMIFLYILNQLPEPEYAINLTCWLVTAFLGLGLADWAEEWGGLRVSVFSLFLWWTFPAVLLLSTGAYIDILLAFFIFLSVRCFQKALAMEWDFRWLILSGLFSGFAFSTKYTGAICPFILGLWMAGKYLKKDKISFSHLTAFGGAAFAPALFWLIKNIMTVGNPVFPFFYRWLGGNVGWTQETAAAYFALLSEYNAKSNVFFELIKSPWSIATASTNFGGGFDVLGDFGWALVIFGFPLAFFLSKKNQVLNLLRLYFAGHFLLWFFTKPVLRFLVGALPIGILLLAFVLNQLAQKGGKITRVITVLLVIPWILSNILIYAAAVEVLKPFDVSLGFSARNEFLRKRLSFYPVYEKVNETLDEGGKLLLLGEQRTYHLKRPFLTANLFAPSPISKLCNEAQSPMEIMAFFKIENIGQVLINGGEIKRLGGLSKFGFSHQGAQNLENFLAAFGKIQIWERDITLYSMEFLQLNKP